MSDLDFLADDSLEEEVVEETSQEDLDESQRKEEDNLFKESEPKVDSTYAGNQLIDTLLKNKGIADSKIEIDGKQENFYSLPLEDQLAIIADHDENEDDNDLDEEEIDLVSKIRDTGLTPNEFLEQYKNLVIDEAKEESATKDYEIDKYSDEELFAYDKKSKVPDITDEELVQAWNASKANESLHQRELTAIRNEYKGLEDQQAQTVAAQNELAKQEQVERELKQYQSKMINTASNIDDIYGLELDDSEKDNVLSDLVEVDDNGETGFDRMVKDPDTLFKMAWFVKYGEEAFNLLYTTFDEELAKTKQPLAITSQSNGDNNDTDIFYEAGKAAIDLSEV
jgi:hypothetical protein